MEMILSNVEALSHDPKAWAVAALVVAKALWSTFMALRCPIMRGSFDVTAELIDQGRNYRIAPPPSFMLIMLGGMALATGGLFMLSDTIYGPLALAAIVVGVFMFMTEPARLFVNGAKMGVFATTGAEGDANFLARDRLREAYRQRAIYEIVIAAVVVAMLVFF